MVNLLDLKGDAKIEILGKADPCKKEPDMIAFSVEFPKMSDCMNHCQKIGGRAPKVVTKEQWHQLQAFMNLNFFNKKGNQAFWLSVTDEKKENDWRDFYTGEIIQYKAPFFGGPNGGRLQNCAVQVGEDK